MAKCGVKWASLVLLSMAATNVLGIKLSQKSCPPMIFGKTDFRWYRCLTNRNQLNCKVNKLDAHLSLETRSSSKVINTVDKKDNGLDFKL